MSENMNALDTQLLYIAAFRYALGRQSYIVPTCERNYGESGFID